jgi:hypothetical protein
MDHAPTEAEKKLTREPLSELAFDQTRKGVMRILESISKQDDLVNRETGDSEFDEHLKMLLDLGLIRNVVNLGGESYEITEAGCRFLDEYRLIERGKNWGPRIGLDRVLAEINKEKVSVVIPTLNEAENIGDIVRNVPPRWELVLVDLSTDGTAQKAKCLRHDVKVIRRGPREVGKGAAIRRGLNEASGSVVITMDGDGSHQTCELVKLVSTLKAQNADMVQASRMLHVNGSEEMSPHSDPLRYFGNRIVTSLINVLFHSSITDSQYGFRAFRKEFISRLSLKSNDWDIETEIVLRAAKCGGKVVEVPSVELQRKHGRSHLAVLDFVAVVGRRLLIEIFRSK